MTTRLEAMVGHLAGLEGDPNLLDELADPSSEASRFLEATRARSRALLGRPDRPARPRPRRPELRSRVGRLAWGGMALLALCATLWVGEARARRLEASFERAVAEGRARSDQLQAALAGLDRATASALDSDGEVRSALGRVDADLGRLEREVRGLSGRPEPPSEREPILDELRDQLAMLRRDLSSGEKAGSRRVDELQSAVHDVARLLRLLVNRSPPAPPTGEAPPRRDP